MTRYPLEKKQIKQTKTVEDKRAKKQIETYWKTKTNIIYTYYYAEFLKCQSELYNKRSARSTTYMCREKKQTILLVNAMKVVV